ncbi:MAG: YciI family protein [Actinobacteria bacterium]|nr:YciI family protein [Actinomycetota bacterium]
MPRYMMSVFGPAERGKLGGYASREEMLQSFADTGAFNSELERDGQLVFADGLEAAPTATTVDGRGETPLFTDGPYLESKEYLGGFWVIEAADLDEALALAARASRACRGKVEVRPFHTAASIEAMLEP